MLKRSLAAVTAAITPFAFGQIVPSVSLDPTAPAGRVTADIFVDLAPTDTWTVVCFRGIAMSGATFHYGRDDDPNSPQPDQLVAPYGSDPVTDQHVTCFSKPRVNRSSVNRFNNNVGIAVAGRFVPTGPLATTVASPSEVNAVLFASPPETSGSPSVDGYIGRISLDFTVPLGQTLGVGLAPEIPSDATVIMMSEGIPSHPEFRGLAVSTFDQPVFAQIDWAIWYVPEPGTALGLAVAGTFAVLVRRQCTRS
jgi:hypothetical protein